MPPTDAHKAEAAKKLENYNAQLVAEIIEKQQQPGSGVLYNSRYSQIEEK